MHRYPLPLYRLTRYAHTQKGERRSPYIPYRKNERFRSGLFRASDLRGEVACDVCLLDQECDAECTVIIGFFVSYLFRRNDVVGDRSVFLGDSLRSSFYKSTFYAEYAHYT